MVAEVCEQLEAAGVSSILLKGRSIADWLYAPTQSRSYGDVDLLVPASRRDRAAAVLMELDFRRERDTSWIAGWSNPADPWHRRSDGAVVDVHTSLPGVAVEPEALWKLLSGEVELMRMGGTDVRVLSPRGRALHLALHVTQHQGGHVRTLRDLQLALEQLDEMTWSGASDLARKVRATPAFTLGLWSLPAGAELADRLELPTPADAKRALQMSRLVHSLRALSQAASTTARIRMLAAKIFPPPRLMRNWSSLADRGVVGLALAYAWRPFWLVGRALTAMRAGDRS